MTVIGRSEVTQQFDILIFAGIINDEHPELSTLTLKLQGPFPVTGDAPAKFAQTELKPGDSIVVKPGDIVTWNIQEQAIRSILILHKEKAKNVFESGPAPVPGSKVWAGVIDKKIGKNDEESYSICWSQGEGTYCFDPKIVVNP